MSGHMSLVSCGLGLLDISERQRAVVADAEVLAR
jgi:hypothetical protein